jgi:hypothetical protein
MEGHVAAVQQLIQHNSADLNIPDKVGGTMCMTVVVVWGLPGRDAVLAIGWEDGARLGDGTEVPRSGAAVGQSGGRPRPAGSGKLTQPNRKVWYTCRLSCSFTACMRQTGWTALMWAAHRGIAASVTALLQGGASRDIVNSVSNVV